ncbi:MAG: hypothetical protein H6Q05_4608, partial [Acidobacteria bacterium]|nr:hypothetical protein [Acidobacteriota bacterium]
MRPKKPETPSQSTGDINEENQAPEI